MNNVIGLHLCLRCPVSMLNIYSVRIVMGVLLKRLWSGPDKKDACGTQGKVSAHCPELKSASTEADSKGEC